jgi:hypothetical protein
MAVDKFKRRIVVSPFVRKKIPRHHNNENDKFKNWVALTAGKATINN